MPGIEGLFLSNSVSSLHCNSYPARLYQSIELCGSYPRISFPKRPVSYSKTSDYQDFQGYARPLRLLPVKEPSICTDSSVEEMSTSLRVDSRSVYVIQLCTSTMFGSGLSDLSAGILICLIDENGDSILQRISPSPVEIQGDGDLPDFCFQRGSVNKFIFEGPKLGRIQALWVGLESGSWRLGGLSLMVVYGYQPPSDNSEYNNSLNSNNNNNNSALQYVFEAEDIPVGDSEGMSMVELKPRQVTELSGVDLSNLSDTAAQSTLLLNREESKEESMKEYADLKSSLLLYDSMLICIGTSISALSSGEKEALAFLIGGAGGFLYLLLLQKSVDGLSAPADEKSINFLLETLKGPIATLALAFVFACVAVKLGSGATPLALTPKEILVGMTGFLACKVSVVLAAFKPMQIKLKGNK